MASFTKYNSSSFALLKSLNASSDSFKVCLTNSVSLTDTTYSSAYDLTTGNGYTNGGNAASTTSFATSGGVAKLILASPATWTASGSGIGPFRYAVLYDSTTNDLIGYWDYGSSISLSGSSGDTFAVALDGTNGVFTVS